MATKHKHRTKHGAMGLLQQAQRSLEKGDFKQALKDAKVCYRQQPGPETRQVLERAYLARGRQLHRAGLHAESQAVAESLLAFGATDASVEQELPELLIAVGLLDRTLPAGRRGPPLEEGDPLYVVAADHAVLRPEGAPASLPAIRQGAAAIRRALAALEAGDEAQAMACLTDVPRASPFADWKYLVRGLAAYYREDPAQMQANWGRLDPSRFSTRIAAPLRGFANMAAAAGDDPAVENAPPPPGALARLENEVGEGRVLTCLERLQDEMTAGRWREAVRRLRASGPRLRQVDPALPLRVGMVLYAAMVRRGVQYAIGDLAAMIELPMDPHGNRGQAMAGERCEDGDPSDVEGSWRAYLEDLAGVECLSPAERTLAQALVWLRLGEMLGEESHPRCPTCGVCHDPDEALQDRAVACFENSLKLAPELLKAHEALANAYEEWGKRERAAAANRRLLERFPENFAALMFLANHYRNRDEPLVARDFLFRAQRLKPLDAQIKAMIRGVHLASARHHALAGRWDEGRAELAAAEQSAGPRAEAHRFLVHRAVLEMKAGQFGLAYRLLDRARNELGEPAPVWLLATVESSRYDVAAFVLAEFEGRWLTATKKGRSSLAAGEMCRIMVGYLEAGVDYPGRKRYIERLVDFLRRCSRTKWQVGDLRNVLEFLMLLVLAEEEAAEESAGLAGADGHAAPSGVEKLLVKFAAKALAKFPDVAYFQFAVGQMELRKGPRKCNRRLARKCFERVVELAEGAGDADTLGMAKRAKEKLLFLDDYDRPRRGAAARPPLAPPDDDALDLPDFFADIDEEFDINGRGPLPGGPPGKLFESFARMCREMGVDPKKVLDEMNGNMPFRFGPKDRSKSARNRKEAT